MQGHRLILFTLFITVIHATKINFFDAYQEVVLAGNQSTVFADLIQLWVDVTECAPTPCSCYVEVNGLSGVPHHIVFLGDKPNKGYVDITNLQPDTLYSFKLNCTGTDQTETRNIKTDYGRPSPPHDIKFTLNSKRLQISWLRPDVPSGPIHKYRLTINTDPTIDNLPHDKLSYDITEDYVDGTEYKIVLVACNVNNKNIPVCSDANQGQVTFIMGSTTTPPAGQTTTPAVPAGGTTTPTIPAGETTTKSNSSNIPSYSVAFLLFVFFFLVNNQVTY
ncbi:unnamed protein product [Adineta steineri]|uniref:Fibronectin type-III domain-containing protein n=1 Tax=Adineta steineri TaxID=433720 RepID=A0A819ADC8_9BILA|nr:unnamed protein product [Adineta steineri]CAF1262105.1 unnamed protein product [Adineta steineri]CAF3783841.1 unnamed protein product [Adineta steineri]CAF4276263.1 unnamed protein product [Adineta steineri]